MKILITGASGFTAHYLIELIAKESTLGYLSPFEYEKQENLSKPVH